MYFLNSRFALIVTIYLIGPIQPNVAIYMLVYYTISFSLHLCFLKQRFQYGKYLQHKLLALYDMCYTV